MQEYSDDDLLKMLRSSINDRNIALNSLYDNMYTSIANFIKRNSGSATDAKDLFQESLIVFYEKAITPNFELTGSIKNYLHAVCRNLWFKKLRKTGREVSVENFEQIAEVVEDPKPSPTSDQGLLFADLMNRIGEGCRDILMRFYFDRQSMKEIALGLNLANEGVAKNKKARCMQKLKAMAQK